MQIFVCDLTRCSRLVKVTVSPEARGCHDAMRRGRDILRSLSSWLRGRWGNRREDSKIVGIIGDKVPRLIIIS